MHKILLTLAIIFATLVYGEDKDDRIEIFATKMHTENNVVHASGDIAVAYKNYYLTSSRAVYNKTTGDLELFDNVRANQNGEYKVLGDYAKLNIINKERSFQPFYMLEEESKVWISAESGVVVDKKLDVSSGVVSGCNPSDPLWKMEFSASDYNLDTKWLNLYHTRFYIYDIPVFYTPWFGYSLDKTRKTGFLRPTLGYSSDEGFLYQQPIFIAEDDWWDLEFTPQIRTNRGKGIYSTFRFTDSKVSQGQLRLGYFKENDNFFTKNSLANQHHRGFDFKYENSDVLNQWTGLNLDGQSGLYAKIGYMNDVDYINLAANNALNISTATQVLSRINLFYNTEDDYFGTYLRYYQDLTKDSNADTIQQLPIVHYHHYLEALLDNHVLYNIDARSNNIHREINKKVTQTDVNIPVSIHTALFDEYVDVTLSTNLHLQHSAFSGKEEIPTGNDYENGYILRNDNKIDVSTQLTKAYDEFSHVINFGTSYSFDGSDKSTGFYEYNQEYCRIAANATEPRCEFYNIEEAQRRSQIYFSQYIYDALGTQIVYHRLSQSVLYGNNAAIQRTGRLGDLENELEYRIADNLDLYNNMFYNHDQNQFSKIYNQISYSDNGLDLSLSHLYRDTFTDTEGYYVSVPTSYDEAHTSYLTTAIKYAYNPHYSYNASYSYDIQNSLAARRKEFGFLYSKRCWDFGIRYVENVRPVLQTINGLTDIGSVPERYIYFTINLKPFMQSGNNPFFAFKLPEEETN